MSKDKEAVIRKDTGKRGRGRPKFEPDLKLVKAMYSLMPTDLEVCSQLHCNPKTLRNLKKRKDFQLAMSEGRGHGKLSLRRAQWKAAQDGNVTMMIFLGKAHLGQSDDGGASQDDPISEIKITVKRPKKLGED